MLYGRRGTMERRKEISGTTRGVQALLLPMFESAFNIDFRASLHALAYQHVTACWCVRVFVSHRHHGRGKGSFYLRDRGWQERGMRR